MSLSLAQLLAAPPDFPVARQFDHVRDAVHHGSTVIQAPPGTGKTTLIPPVVADILAGHTRVVVTQPRRVAARAAARHLAELLGEKVGETVGFSIRGESKSSARTRIEFVTPGVLVARLQRDPELPGTGAVILDEVHERHLDSDLALALCLDVRDTLRDDMMLIAMSATVETEKTAAILGSTECPATIVEIPGDIHPVECRWRPPIRGAEPLGTINAYGTTGVRREFLAHVAGVVRAALEEEKHGDILVFLPGVREVSTVAATLEGCGAEVLTLHGSLSSAQQDRILSGSGQKRRVIVSTAIAESSLTVPGVRIVVDGGLAREPRTDYARGIGGLITVLESQAAGTQRAGRAGRLGPGVVYRCFAETTWARMASHSEPEIRTADLTDFMLQAACWGAPGGSGLALLDAPPAPATRAAHDTLLSLGAVAADGLPTPLGRALARIPLNPRLARALILSAPLMGAHAAAEVCALIDEDLRIPGADLAHGWRTAARDSATWKSHARRLESLLRWAPDHSLGEMVAVNPRGPDEQLATAVGLAYPERVARIRKAPNGSPASHDEQRRYLAANGVGATLPEGSPLIGQQWLAIAQLDRAQGNADALIRAAIPLDVGAALELAAPLKRETVEISLRGGRLRSRTLHQLGAIELSSTDNPRVAPEDARAWIAAEWRAGRLTWEWSRAAAALRDRLAFLHRVLGDPWPDVSDGALAQRLDEWAGPELEAFAHGKALTPVTARQLERLFPWPEAARLADLAPTDVTTPRGRTVPIDYSGDLPIARMRLQDAFGWVRTPAIAGGVIPLTVELLSPAQRPLALTNDLESFWAGPYTQVRAEMRGRYVKHAWPENPLEPLC